MLCVSITDSAHLASFITFFRATYKQKHMFQTAGTRVPQLASTNFCGGVIVLWEIVGKSGKSIKVHAVSVLQADVIHDCIAY